MGRKKVRERDAGGERYKRFEGVWPTGRGIKGGWKMEVKEEAGLDGSGCGTEASGEESNKER